MIRILLYNNRHFIALLSSPVRLNLAHLGGILSQLRNASSSLNSYLNLFNVTKSSGFKDPYSVFNQDDDNNWYTDGSDTITDPQWIQIEMKSFSLTICGYILMTYNAVPSYPKNFYLEGRNSESEPWQIIDKRDNVTELNGIKKVKSFINNIIPFCTFRIFRLTQTEDWSLLKNNQLGLNEMDFIVFLPSSQFKKLFKCTASYRRRPKLILTLLILATD